MFLFDGKNAFPDPRLMLSDEDILLIDHELTADKMEFGYRIGAFEWSPPGPVCQWWCPAERFVLFPEKLKISTSMRKILRREQFQFTFNQHFKEVVQGCATVDHRREKGSWLTESYEECLMELHRRGLAKSIEVWDNDVLVGGLYGMLMGNIFCGESMFAKVSNASKAGFIWFVTTHQNQLDLIDCQIYSEHLESLGAEEMPRRTFLSYLPYFQT